MATRNDPTIPGRQFTVRYEMYVTVVADSQSEAREIARQEAAEVRCGLPPRCRLGSVAVVQKDAR